MTDFRTSETAKNLMRAFAGESQARNRYSFAAQLARKQKLPSIEAIFLFTASQEKAHGEVFYNYLSPLEGESIVIDAGFPVNLEQNVLAQLKMAVHNEFEEHDQVYKQFGEIAEKEGFVAVANTFRMIGQIEQAHGERFKYLADLLEEGKLYKADMKTGWVCLNCGHLHYGTEAPEKCPVCSHDQGWFIRMELAPWHLGH